MSVGSFDPLLLRLCCNIPLTIASARLPWWFIFSRFCFTSSAIILVALIIYGYIKSALQKRKSKQSEKNMENFALVEKFRVDIALNIHPP